MKKNTALREKIIYKDFRELVECSCEKFSDRIAYSYRKDPRDKEILHHSFKELGEDIRALTAELSTRGFAGKHCAVIGRLSYSFVRMYFALSIVGAVMAPLDADWSAEDLCDTVENANADFLFCDREVFEKGKYIKDNLGLSFLGILSGEVEGYSNVDSLVADGREKFNKDPSLYYDCEINPEKLSLLVFTSGTTGKGKGVMLTQKSILTNLSDVLPYVDFGKKTVGVLPPHHTYGSTVLFAGHVMIGAEVYISSGLKYVPGEFKEQKPEHLILVPLYLETFYRKMQSAIKDKNKTGLIKFMIKVSNALRKIGIDLRKKIFAQLREALGGEVKMVVSGGAPINSEIISFFDAIGISSINGYGITECSPIIAANHSKHTVDGSVGWVCDSDHVIIDSPNEDGEGEILVKGPNVMLGYYNNPEATKEAIDERGYFKTGDYGKFGKEGALFITGRKKNLIILSNGKNVYPEEIENEFIATPGVLDIIVYEGQSRRGLEHNAIVAEFYLDKDYLSKNGVTDAKKYLQGYVDAYNKTAVPYKKITVIKVRDTEFPKNTLKKILRFKLDMTID